MKSHQISLSSTSMSSSKARPDAHSPASLSNKERSTGPAETLLLDCVATSDVALRHNVMNSRHFMASLFVL